jgi:hypothetical protein
MTVVQTIDLIAVDPYVRSGRPYILGTTVTVSDIAIAKLYHAKDVDGIGDWVRYLELLAAFYQPEEILDRVEYL